MGPLPAGVDSCCVDWQALETLAPSLRRALVQTWANFTNFVVPLFLICNVEKVIIDPCHRNIVRTKYIT